MDCCDRSAQRPPSTFIHREGYNFLTIRNQMGAEYGTHARGITGALKLDRAVDAIRVGAGERGEPPLGGRPGEYLRAGDAKAEGEVGVGVEVGEHWASAPSPSLCYGSG